MINGIFEDGAICNYIKKGNVVNVWLNGNIISDNTITYKGIKIAASAPKSIIKTKIPIFTSKANDVRFAVATDGSLFLETRGTSIGGALVEGNILYIV